jgi:hypothetical protein
VSYGPDPVDDDKGDVLLNDLENTKDFLGLMRDVLAVIPPPCEKVKKFFFFFFFFFSSNSNTLPFSDFTALVNLFNTSNIDVVLCDHLVDACVDAAKATNKTFIITLVGENTKGKYHCFYLLKTR